MPGTILITFGGCAEHLAHVLGRERVREFSEYVQAVGVPDLDTFTVGGRRARIAPQDSCHLRNGLGVHRQPRKLTAGIADLVQLPAAATCCGAAGTYALLRPRDAAAVLATKLDEIKGAAVDYVTVNLGCQRQLIAVLRGRKSPTRMLHIAGTAGHGSRYGTTAGTARSPGRASNSDHPVQSGETPWIRPRPPSSSSSTRTISPPRTVPCTTR